MWALSERLDVTSSRKIISASSVGGQRPEPS